MAVWEKSQAAQLTQSNAEMKANRVKAIKERLLALGYHQDDIESISRADPVAVARPLTDKSASGCTGLS